jgi:esterase
MSKSTLHYQVHGSGNEHAPVLVLIHGLFGSADNLSVIRRAFEQDYRVISIDLPDHSESPRSNGFSFSIAAQQILLTLKHLQIDKANFVGHSLGGKVAMYLAFLQPAIIDKIIVLDIAPIAYSARHQNVIEGLNSVNLQNINTRKDAKVQLSQFVHDPGTQGFLLKSLYQTESGSWAWRFNLQQLIKDYDTLSEWPLLDQVVFERPILFIKGEHSDYITKEHHAIIMKQFPKALAKIVNAGHWLHAEKPQVVNSLITKHLRA